MSMRLNKFIASSGMCSRRDADRLISGGLVTINGMVAAAGDQVSENDVVMVSGREVRAALPKMIVFNKPVGVVCSEKSNDRAQTYAEYLKLSEHLFPVGRLDKDSEGLLLLTNMGDLSEKIARAGETHEKEYEVTCKKPLSGMFFDRMRKGVRIKIPAEKSTTGEEEIYTTRPCRVTRTGETSFSIILTEGKNRQIRRMCEALGHKVVKLRRVRIMNITLGDLPTGASREITMEEMKKLEELL